MFTITKEWVKQFPHRKPAGWTKEQLACIGVQWPIMAGWIDKIVGNQITEEQALKFESYRDRPSDENRVIPQGGSGTASMADSIETGYCSIQFADGVIISARSVDETIMICMMCFKEASDSYAPEDEYGDEWCYCKACDCWTAHPVEKKPQINTDPRTEADR